ncbi:MAG: helix-hairpin-helix domain-containing protein [Gemmatimonadota bacterium]
MSPSSELQRIPGVGPSISKDLQDLGMQHVQDLRDGDPEKLYEQLCALRGTHIDRCVLYIFRCAVYFASNEEHDPALLKWWNWKDSAM